jgi:hypothetical protein
VGRAHVTATLVDAHDTPTVNATLQLLVLEHVMVWPSPSPLYLLPESQVPFRLQQILPNGNVQDLLPTTASSYRWRSSDPTVASVHPTTGVLTALAPGTVEVRSWECARSGRWLMQRGGDTVAISQKFLLGN